MSTRTITLTGRPPVTIDEDVWPCIAQATDSAHDGQFEWQADRRSKWGIRVRRHADGRAIVYATYRYSSCYQGERDYAAKRGVLLAAGSDAAAICAAIERVCRDMCAQCHGSDAGRWPGLAAECIAALPADELV